MAESVGVYRSLEHNSVRPVEQVRVNQAVEGEVRSVIPPGQEPGEYFMRRVGMSSGETNGSRESLRVISPTGKRALTLRFFRPKRVGNACFTSLTAKGVGIGEASMTDGEDPFGLLGNRSAERELQTSESLHRNGVRVSRVAAILSLDGAKLQQWLSKQPKGRYQLDKMLQRLNGEQPAIVVRFDNPRWSDLFRANARGPYSAKAIARLGAQALYTELDMSNGGNLLGAVYKYPRSQQAQVALSEIVSSKTPSQETLKEYLLLEAFFSGYNHKKLLQAGGRLQTARAPQDMLVGGAIFTDFESLDVFKGTTLSEVRLQQQGNDFAESIARMISQQGYTALHLLGGSKDLQEIQDIFLEGFSQAA